MPSKNKFPLSGLSKQQKEILKIIYEDKDKREAYRYLSRKIARKFNKENKERISNSRGFSSLTNKHSASISRSIKRLIERGLIKKWERDGFLICFELTEKGLEWCKKKIERVLLN